MSSGFHNSAIFAAMRLLGFYAPPSVDPSGNSDSDAGINAQLANTMPGRVVQLPPGIFATVAPIIPVTGVGLIGPMRNTQSGNQSVNDWGAVIKPVFGWSTGRPNPAAIMFDGSGTNTVYRAWISNLGIDGTGSTPGIGGISVTGSAQATGIYGINLYSPIYRGLAAYKSGSLQPGGFTIKDIVIQSPGDVGLYGVFQDTYGENVHVQGGSSDGATILGNNNKWVGFRSDLNAGHGIITDAPSGNLAGGFLDANQFIGGGTQRNTKHGFLANNGSATGTDTRAPVILRGFHLDGDGVNGGAGGGGFAGLALGGAVIVEGDVAVLVHTEDVPAGCPNFAVTTFALGTAPGKPQGLKLAGILNSASATIINDGAPVALRLIDALGFSGGQIQGTSVLVHTT